MAPEIELTGVMKEKKNRKAHGYTEKQRLGRLVSLMEKAQYPGAQHIYYIELNRNPWLLHTDKPGRRFS